MNGNKLQYALTWMGILCLSQLAHANAIKISLDPSTHVPSDVPFNDVGGNPVSVFEWLQGEIQSWNNNFGQPLLPDPTAAHTRFDDLNTAPTLDLLAGDYIAIHYNVGVNGVPGDGGGLVAYYIDQDQSYTPPSSGEGPKGTGGILFIDVWDHVSAVPDGGTTAALLFGAVTVICAFAGSLQDRQSSGFERP
jgi:hypothetical protein